MSKKAAFITVHGMGRTKPHYNEKIVREIKGRLGFLSNDLHIGKVYYQDILQQNEERVWNRIGRRVRWDILREFILYGFADATGLESNKEGNSSDYWKAQLVFAKELLQAREAMGGDGPVLILAQSLGSQVASCYFWDAGRAARGEMPASGIWRNISDAESQITGGRSLTDEEIKFLQGSCFRVFITTGCNIPIFVAAHAKEDIIPIKPNNRFEWHNFYDQDDVLGWPLADLSEKYHVIVKDYSVNVGGGMMGWLLRSWNPLSHTQYWADDDVLDPLENHLRKLIV